MEGIDDIFNTIRVGKTWMKRIAPGDTVLLMDKKRSVIFGKARVQSILSGKLNAIEEDHARYNHNQKNNADIAIAPARLRINLRKRYGPQIIHDNKIVTVIYMKRLE